MSEILNFPKRADLDTITDKAYSLLELALDQAYSKLEAGEIVIDAKDIVALLSLLKKDPRPRDRRM